MLKAHWLWHWQCQQIAFQQYLLLSYKIEFWSLIPLHRITSHLIAWHTIHYCWQKLSINSGEFMCLRCYIYNVIRCTKINPTDFLDDMEWEIWIKCNLWHLHGQEWGRSLNTKHWKHLWIMKVIFFVAIFTAKVLLQLDIISAWRACWNRYCKFGCVKSFRDKNNIGWRYIFLILVTMGVKSELFDGKLAVGND